MVHQLILLYFIYIFFIIFLQDNFLTCATLRPTGHAHWNKMIKTHLIGCLGLWINRTSTLHILTTPWALADQVCSRPVIENGCAWFQSLHHPWLSNFCYVWEHDQSLNRITISSCLSAAAGTSVQGIRGECQRFKLRVPNVLTSCINRHTSVDDPRMSQTGKRRFVK